MIRLGFVALVFGACSFSGAPAAKDNGGGGDNGGEAIDASSGNNEVDAAVSPIDAAPADAALPEAVIVVERTASAPDVTDNTFDGSEWSGVARHSVSFASDEHEHIDQGYSEDASATFGVVHDDTYIYLVVEVDDDLGFDADGIQVYFDSDGDRDGAFAADDAYATIESDGTALDHGTTIDVDGSIFPGAANGDRIYELRFAKAELGTGVDVGAIGFNISLRDADNEAGGGGWALFQQPSGPRCDTCCNEAHSEPWCDTTLMLPTAIVP